MVAPDLFHDAGAALDGRAAGDVKNAEFYGRAAGVERQDELVRREAARHMAQRPRAADEEHFCLPNASALLNSSERLGAYYLPRASCASQQLLATRRNLVLAR